MGEKNLKHMEAHERKRQKEILVGIESQTDTGPMTAGSVMILMVDARETPGK
jgi:hypothetical protein